MNLDASFLRQSIYLTVANMKARYRKTFAGFVWVVMNPLIMFGAQSIVFNKFLKLEIDNFFIFLLSNLLPWIFIINNLHMCASIFEEKRNVLRSFQVNPLVFVCAQLLDNFVNFLFVIIVLGIPLLYFFDASFIGLAYLPVALLMLASGSFLLSLFAATLQVFFKDVKFMVQFISSVVFFITPIFYPIEFVPEKYRILIEFNIFYILIKPINICLHSFDFNAFIIAISKAGLVNLILILLQYKFWKAKRNEFYIKL